MSVLIKGMKMPKGKVELIIHSDGEAYYTNGYYEGYPYRERLYDIERFTAVEIADGEWVTVKGSNGKDYRKCTNCLHTQEITGLLNYCPICGAKMRESKK